MSHRIVEIAEDERYLSRSRGFLVVAGEAGEIGRVPLDDIGAVIVSARQASYSNNLLAELAERNIPLVICGENFAPKAWLWPFEGHHLQYQRLNAQIAAPAALKKKLWRDIVRAKVLQQQAALLAVGAPSGGVGALAVKVKPGDPDNIEAQAAKRYWGLMMGEDFRRERHAGGRNAMLNYGYAVIRSAAARAVVAAGLHPTVSLFHSNRANAFALVDDLMEPFRPFADLQVLRLWKAGHEEVDKVVKTVLARLLVLDLETPRGVSPMTLVMQRAAASLAESYLDNRCAIDLPPPQKPLFALGGAME